MDRLTAISSILVTYIFAFWLTSMAYSLWVAILIQLLAFCIAVSFTDKIFKKLVAKLGMYFVHLRILNVTFTRNGFEFDLIHWLFN